MRFDEVKTPCYVYDMEAFRKNANDVLHGVRQHYPNFRLGYSYKTNYFRPFLLEARKLGLYAEIVSREEYELALSIFELDRNIIYNGVIEDFSNKLSVASQGGIVNVENMHELMKFVEYSNNTESVLRIGVRVNFDLGNGLTSRFGIDVDAPEFEWLCNPFNHPFLDIDCVHFQFGGSAGGLRTPEVFSMRVRKCVEIARKLGAKVVDIGGNIIGRMDADFVSQFPYAVPSLEDVCSAIGEEMKKCCPKGDILLIAECGSALVTNAMHLLTTITNINVVRGKTFITCDCRCTDAGWSITRYNPAHTHYGQSKTVVANAKVCGCECREEDVLIRTYSGPASIGDQLLLKNVGAYSYSVVNNFITRGCRRCLSIEELPSFD